MKNNISYYSHDCDSHDHRKFKKLRGKYDFAGEGRFWTLNNLIGKSDDCLLDLNDELTLIDTADVLKMTFKQLEEFVAYLVECRLVYYVGEKITTDRCQETLQKVSKDRENARNRKKGVSPNHHGVSSNSGRSSPELNGSSTEKRADSRIKKERKKERGDFKSPNEEKANPSDVPGFVELEKELTSV